MSGFSADKAELTALLLETFVFGIFFTFFLILVAICRAKVSIRLANWQFILVIAIAMMGMSMTHLALSFARVIRGFTTGYPGRLPDPNSYLAELSDPLRASKSLIYGLQTLLGDAVLVWRCYIVYNRSLYAIIPTGAALLGNVALSIPISVSLYHIAPGVSVFSKGAWQIAAIASFFITTMCLNLCCTIAIVVKLWRTYQCVSPNYGRSLFPVIAVIIESGALYTAGVSSLVVTFLARSNGQQIPLDIITPLVGVVFCLIVLQIHFQIRVLKPPSRATTTRSFLAPPRWEIRDTGAPTYELRSSVAVHIARHASTDYDPDVIPDPKPQLTTDRSLVA